MSVGLVVDSTTDYPLEYYQEHDVTMVPLTVRFGEELYRDWVDICPDECFRRMREGEVPKTSQPTAGEFAEAYKALADGGATEIVSLHISDRLSGTIQSATVGAQQSPVPVRVLDGGSASLATGLILDRLVEARDAGAAGEELERLVEEVRLRIRLLYTVKSLKWLEVGGRIGKAASLLGTLLDVRPILTITDGEVAAKGKAKGSRRAMEEMVATAVADGAEGPMRLAFLYADDRGPAERLQAMIRQAGVLEASSFMSQIGCVIGAYLGPGAFGVIYERAAGAPT